jgi:diketogulonate reductase-like aldo/keto reductase
MSSACVEHRDTCVSIHGPRLSATLQQKRMPTHDHLISEIPVPWILYGTAWKEDRSSELTETAIRNGFRGIDTANQRKHYDEASVGQGILAAIQAGVVTREDLFLQTKFTFQAGQDHRLPYDPQAPIPEQVEQSAASSLRHLNTTWLDSFILHGPSVRTGLAVADLQAWQAMEQLVDRGIVRLLGISNVSLEQLELLCARARIAPRFVQNRCYASTGWDAAIRRYCSEAGITYQGFSLLTANRAIVVSESLATISRRHDRTPEQIVFRFALQAGMIPLTGTTSEAHMQADIAVADFELSSEEVAIIESIGVRTRQ